MAQRGLCDRLCVLLSLLTSRRFDRPTAPAQRVSPSWQTLFSYFPNLEYSVSDLGQGILGGARRASVVSQADMLHVLWLFPKTVALDDLEAILEARELIIQAMSPFTKDHRLATRRSQVKLVGQAIERLGTIRTRTVGAITLQKTLTKNKNRLVNFTRELWNIDVQLRDGSSWNEKQVIAALGRPMGLCKALDRSCDPDETRRLCGLLPRAFAMRFEALKQCENGEKVEAELSRKVAYLLRSSSLEEMINGKLRPVQAIKKRVNQPFLSLWALKHNLTRYEQGKRAGRSPYEIQGVHLEGDDDGWLGVLMAEARKEGMPE